MTPNWNQLPLDKKEYVNLSADTVNKTVKNIGGSNLLIPMQIEGNIVTVYDRLGNRFYKFATSQLYYAADSEKKPL